MNDSEIGKRTNNDEDEELIEFRSSDVPKGSFSRIHTEINVYNVCFPVDVNEYEKIGKIVIIPDMIESTTLKEDVLDYALINISGGASYWIRELDMPLLWRRTEELSDNELINKTTKILEDLKEIK